jgi:hypothetical protein
MSQCFKKKPTGTLEGFLATLDRFGYDEMSNERIHSIISPIVECTFRENGWKAIRPLFWVRSTDAPIRQLFWFTKWKGAAIAPGWGLSLDFVPHVSARKIAWHRTPKSACSDIGVEADEIPEVRDQTSMYYTAGPVHIANHAEGVVSAVAPIAEQFWDSFRTTDRLLEAVEYSKALSRGGMRAQLNLAEAFINGHFGDPEKGRISLESELSHWQILLIDDDYARLSAKLFEAFAQACNKR